MWWSAQDAADYADGKLAEALRQLHSGELADEYVPSAEDLDWARRELDDPNQGSKTDGHDIVARFEGGLRDLNHRLRQH